MEFVRRRSQLSIAALVALTIVGCSVETTESSVSIGLVTNNVNGLRNIDGFKAGMSELGYEEGRNVEYVFANEPLSGDRLDDALGAMVASDVDLIFTAGTPTGVAAHRITRDAGIPVVFGVIADPIKAGVMADLAAPGGNMTGVKLGEDQSRRLQWLTEIDPTVRRVLVPFNPGDTAPSSAVAQVEALAPGLGLELVLAPAPNDQAVTDLLADFPSDVDAMFLVPDSVVNARLAELLDVASAAGLPTSGPSIAQVDGGALMSYGFVHHEAGSQAASIAVQVLNGTDPGSIPVQNTESFLAINLVAASDIGLEISDDVLRQADIIVRGS
jgi:putative ABC transport system substrate-binding protein